MCGICGVAGRGIQLKDIDIFNDLLHVTGLRGDSSTGVFVFDPSKPRSKKCKLVKELGPSALFLYKEDRKKLHERAVNSLMTELVMGHCRYPTKGKVSVENAHPFDTGRYVSTHNGTLVDKRYSHSSKTDSQMMFEDMEKRGVAKVLEGLEYMSAYAVSIFDKNKRSLTLATNGDRPLHYGVNKERRVLYYASELSALHFVAQRRKTPMDYFVLEPNIVYTVKLEDITHRREDFWSVIDLGKKSSPSGKEWDWISMSWVEERKKGEHEPEFIGPGERSCLCCAKEIDEEASKDADVFHYNGRVYYTCAECTQDAKEATQAANEMQRANAK